MRILTKEEAKQIDIQFIYSGGNSLAIVDKNILNDFKLVRK